MSSCDSVIDFAAEDSCVIQGRGTVYYGPSPQVMRRDHPEIIGRTVRIRDRLFVVRGVERFLPLRPIAVGESIGLLVEETE